MYEYVLIVNSRKIRSQIDDKLRPRRLESSPEKSTYGDLSTAPNMATTTIDDSRHNLSLDELGIDVLAVRDLRGILLIGDEE